MTKTTILFITLIICLSCAFDKNNSTYSGKEKNDTIPYKMVRLYESSPYYQAHEDRYDTTYFKASFPQAQDSVFNELILKSMQVKNIHEMETFGESFLSEYNSYVEEAQHPEYIHAWFHELHISIPLHIPTLLVVRSRTDEYSGGAHGNYFELFYNYDLKNQSEIQLYDIIDSNKRKEFLNIAESYFRIQEGLSEDDSLEKDYFFTNGEFDVSNHFSFSKKDLTFQYNPYEIKAFVEGMTTLHIPYEALTSIMTNKGKVYVEEINRYYSR